MPFNWQTVSAVFQQELDALYVAGGPFIKGPSTHKLLHQFSLSQLRDQLAMHSPCLSSTISTLNHPTDDSTEASVLQNVHSITALSILARKRSNKLKGLPLLVGLMLIARAVHKQVIANLNHLGISLIKLHSNHRMGEKACKGNC